MVKRRKRRDGAAATEAPVEVSEQEAPEPAANSTTPGKTERRRGGDATADQEASAAVHAHGPSDSGKETADKEGKKPNRKKQKRKKTDQSPRAPASDADAAATGKSGDGCTDGVGVLGDAGVSTNPRNWDDTDRLEVNIGEKATPERKKPKRRKKNKRNMPSPSAVSDDNAAEVDKSRTDCKDVPGDDKTIRSTRNGEDPGFSAQKIAAQEIPKRKKPRLKKRKNNKQEQSLSAVADGNTVVVGTSGNDCPHGQCVSGVADVSMSSGNGEDQDPLEVNVAEKGTPERKKPKLKKPKENKQERSPAAVSDDGAVQSHKSGNVCIDEDDASGDAQVSTRTRNVEDTYHPEVSIAEKETNERKPKKRKNKKEGSSSVVLDAGAVGDGGPQDIEASICPRNGEDPDCPVLNNAEKGIPETHKPKRKKRKNSREQSPSVVLDAGDVVVDASGHDSTNVGDISGSADVTTSPRIGEGPEYPKLNVEDAYHPEINIAEKETNERKPKKRKNKKEGSSSVVLDAGAVGDGGPQDIEASICPRNGEDPDCPVLNNAEKGIPETHKPKRKKRKNSREQSPSVVLDAGDVVVDASGHDSTNVGDISGSADVTMSPRIGESPEYPKLNATDDFLEGNKVSKDYFQKHKPKKQMKNKHEQSPSAVPDTCASVEDKSGKSYIDGKGSLGDTEISTSPRNGKDHDCPKVNIANDLVEGTNENNDSSQEPKNKKRKRKNRAEVAVTKTPPVGDVSSDERKDVCRTGSMKVAYNSDIVSMTSTSGENHKENIQDIYSPGGSLVRFQRKKLLILDLNGILVDINTDRNVTHMVDGRVRGKNVFKRPYCDDFLRFCFQNFELGIWSSRMKFNVDAVLNILMKDLRRHLVFCWDVSQCTTTRVATLENHRKPLVLKELKKLWNKEDPYLPWEQGEFSASNTLLVDDSPYKALRNPPYTAIFPQSYSYHMKEDKSLGPGGDLRVYLENIATADDVQRYVKEHPFGQPSITRSDPNWNFYKRIHYQLDAYAGREF